MGMVVTRSGSGTRDREPATTTLSMPLPDARRILRSSGEAVLAAVLAGLVSLAVQGTVERLGLPVRSFAPLAVASLSAAVVIAVVLVLAGRSLRPGGARWSPKATPLVCVGLAALSSSSLALMLVGTKHYIFGISGDQSFRVQYLTRFVASPALADTGYADLPPYYPAGWFWVGGRLAALAGMAGWEAYKPLAIATMAVAGVLAFVTWSLVVNRPQAALFGLVTAVVGLRVAAYEPYSWVLTAVLAPLAAIAWRLMRAVAAGAAVRQWAGSAVLLGAVLGVAGMVYTLIFGFLGFVLLVMGAAALRVQRGAAPPGAAGRVGAAFAVIGAVALPLVLVAWAPFLIGIVERGFRSGAAQRFLPEIGAAFPLPMVELSVFGVLTLIGTGWIVLRWGQRTVAQALGILVLAGYAWFALSTLALAAGTTLLAFRVEPAMAAALACAGVLGLLDVGRVAARRAGPGRATAVGVALAVASFAAVLSLMQAVPDGYAWSREASYGDYYPTGTRPTGSPDETDPGAWNDELLAGIDELTGRAPQEVIMLSTHHPLLTYRPYFTFQAAIDQYANPLADFPARRAQIERWAASTTPEELLAALDAAPDRPPWVFVLQRESDGLHLTLTYDRFPEEPNVGSYSVVFAAALFDHPDFTRRDVGPFTVVVRAAADPR